MLAALDTPLADTPCDPLVLPVEGWLYLGPDQPKIASVEALLNGVSIGSTAQLTVRADVNAAHALPPTSATAFRFFGYAAQPDFGRAATLTVLAQFRDGGPPVTIAERSVHVIRQDHRQNAYGVLLTPELIALHHREHIYGSGPSLAVGSGEMLALAQRYLGPPPVRLLDVGCGLGWYGAQLRSAGYDWHGAEMKPADCAAMAAAGLPHTQVDGNGLPFAAGAFDAALCIEVLEHIPEPRAFLAEIRRVAPGRLIVSVPNAELIAYLHNYLAVPWHMLEADHKNFFTRWSLGSLLREFYAHVEVGFHTVHPLRTPEGTPAYYNLFAVARTP
jgi:SAM-dependent methyltransferase